MAVSSPAMGCTQGQARATPAPPCLAPEEQPPLPSGLAPALRLQGEAFCAIASSSTRRAASSVSCPAATASARTASARGCAGAAPAPPAGDPPQPKRPPTHPDWSDLKHKPRDGQRTVFPIDAYKAVLEPACGGKRVNFIDLYDKMNKAGEYREWDLDKIVHFLIDSRQLSTGLCGEKREIGLFVLAQNSDILDQHLNFNPVLHPTYGDY